MLREMAEAQAATGGPEATLLPQPWSNQESQPRSGFQGRHEIYPRDCAVQACTPSLGP